MIKKILELKGAQQLSKKEQNAINGGAGGLCIDECYNGGPCSGSQWCHVTMCYPAGPEDPFSYLFGVCMGNEQ